VQSVAPSPPALADLRSREDALRARLDTVRTRLEASVALARELAQLEERAQTACSRGGAYRGEASAVGDRLATARRARVERAALRLEEASLMTQLESIRAQLEKRGIKHFLLPVLENVQVASPCDVGWAEMEGDSDVRHCARCHKHVYNLSTMSRAEAEAVLTAAKASEGMCVRFYRRSDGTMITDDCPVGSRRTRFWRRTTGAAAAGLLLAALGLVAYTRLACAVHVQQAAVAQGALGFQ
jgi:hypothetical protein